MSGGCVSRYEGQKRYLAIPGNMERKKELGRLRRQREKDGK
jgi:hypothetical protein